MSIKVRPSIWAVLTIFACSSAAFAAGSLDARITPNQAIERAVNAVTQTDSGIALRHPKHEAMFDAGGMAFRPRHGGGDWQWRLVRMGRGKGEPQQTPQPYDADGRVEFNRGPVTEQWVPRASVIEQRFILHAKPAGAGDFVVEGAVTSPGAFEVHDGGWLWRTNAGVVSLGHVFAFDAHGVPIAARMEVDAGSTRIVVDGNALDSAKYPVTIDPEVGTNDFRISAMDTDGDANFDALDPAVAYNSTNNEYLVVWHGDLDNGTLVDEEFEIYGQRINASDGSEVGNDDFRISDMGTDGSTSFAAFSPAVAYNSTNNEYLVVWEGDDSATNGFEIYGQRIFGDLNDGDETGNNDFQISDMGPGGSNAEDASEADVAYNSTENEYLVVWHGDDTDAGLAANEQEVFAQRIEGDKTSGDEVGTNDIRVSDLGDSNDATFNAVSTHVAYNSTDNEYLVVWSGDDNVGGLIDEDLEVFGQRLDGADASELGTNDFRISDVAGTGTTARQAFFTDVAYNSINNEYLVVWNADDSDASLADNEFEIFAQRLDASDGSEQGTNDFVISDAAGINNSAFDAERPRVAYSPARNEYLVVWSTDDDEGTQVQDEIEIRGQFIFGDLNDGDESGTNDFRISDMATDADTAFGAFAPAVDYNSTNNEFGIVWYGDDDDIGLADDEFEIFMQRFDPGNAPPLITLPSAALDYDILDPATAIDAAGTLTDPDSADLNGGALTVSLTANGTANDQLTVLTAGGITVAGSTVSFGGNAIGDIDGTDNGVNGADLTINFNTADATPTAAQALVRGIAYSNSSATPSGLSRTASFTASDGDGGTSFAATQTINVVTTNDDPVLTLPGAALDYDENDPATAIDGTATVSDIDSADFDGGSLNISFTANGTANDQLSVLTAGGITVAGSTVSFGGNAIGTIDGTDDGVNGADLTINFNTADATPAAVQALARAIGYANSSDNPSGLTRTATFTVTDGDGGSSGGIDQSINVIPSNDNPALALPGGPLNFNEGDPASVIDSTATVSDVDSADFNGGALNVSFAINGTVDDQLAVSTAGGITVAGSTVSFSGNAIGTIDGTDDGVNGADLTINLNTADATPAAVQALVRAITFANNSVGPSTLPRTVAFTATDGDGGSSGAINTTVNVSSDNSNPFLLLPSGAANYFIGGGPVLIDPAAIVTDPDGVDFDTGTLTVDVTVNNSDDDRLGINNQGNGAGQVGVSGSTVSYGGTAVGTFSGGAKAIAPLVVTFNASATGAAVQAVARNITFNNVAASPSIAPRTVAFTITDGDGGTPAVDTQTVNVGAMPLPVNPAWLVAAFAAIGSIIALRRRHNRAREHA